MAPTSACARARAASVSSMAWTHARSEVCSWEPNMGSRSSDIEEHRLVRTLQMDVEAVRIALTPREQRCASGDGRQIVRREIDARHNVAQQTAREHHDVGEGGGTGLEPKPPGGVRGAAPEAAGLRELDERIVDGIPCAVVDDTCDAHVAVVEHDGLLEKHPAEERTDGLRRRGNCRG